MENQHSQDFESKRQQLFACLEQAENGLKGTNLDQSRKTQREQHKHKSKINRTGTISKFRGKESIFKKPELPLIKCLKPRIMPDYQVNPHKWKKYSLGDVDISDRTNTAAAFSFLKEVEGRESSTVDCKNSMEIDAKPTFNKPISGEWNLESEESETLHKSSLRGAKVVMPEYVIGQKVPKPQKKNRQNTKLSEKQLKLQHLFDEEEEEDN